jgi:predicted ABC-type transport system involved in lysophospholipase L1 biosynthesis ATPase subunit
VNGEPAIEINGLTKSFGDKVVVNNVDLTVNRGEIVGFLGPNGSGKTTTIRMICGLLSADSGTGRCLGYDIRTEADRIKNEVGYMTQRFWRASASPTARTRSPAPCRAAGSSDWPCRRASCISPNCSSSTSRPPGSTPRRGANSGTRSTSLPPTA